MGDVVEGDHRRAGLRLQLLPLAEVVLQQGFEVVAAPAEKRLQTQTQGEVTWSFSAGGGGGGVMIRACLTLWHRKLKPSTLKQMSGYVGKRSTRLKGSSPNPTCRDPTRWGRRHKRLVKLSQQRYSCFFLRPARPRVLTLNSMGRAQSANWAISSCSWQL